MRNISLKALLALTMQLVTVMAIDQQKYEDLVFIYFRKSWVDTMTP